MKVRFLYIEDNEQNFYLVSFILKTRGHEVVWAKDGERGIEEAERNCPNVILLDIQLPVMDGYTVARKLRSDPRFAETPIVALTSYAMPGDCKRALDAGCTGYIEKPINPDTFVAQIEGYIDPSLLK